MKLPTASDEVSSGILHKPTRLRFLSFRLCRDFDGQVSAAHLAIIVSPKPMAKVRESLKREQIRIYLMPIHKSNGTELSDFGELSRVAVSDQHSVLPRQDESEKNWCFRMDTRLEIRQE